MDYPHFIDEEIPLWDTNAVSHRESTGKQNIMRRILISPLRGSVDVLTGPALLWEGERWRVLGVPCSPGPWWCKVSLKGDHVRTGRRPAVFTCGCCFHGLGFVLSFKWSQSHFWHGSRNREGKGENGLMHLRQEIDPIQLCSTAHLSMGRDVTLEAWNWPQKEYIWHGNQQLLQICSPLLLSPLY